ncbi:MAG TPA: hypothetical protein DC017_09690 [Candidatus Wallbacteria bacterium]|nr:hypothetical protein [Candidatus Wallbacteria bacterium]
MEFFYNAPAPLIILYLLFFLGVLVYAIDKIVKHFYTSKEIYGLDSYIDAIKETSPEERKIIKDFLIDIGIVKDESR